MTLAGLYRSARNFRSVFEFIVLSLCTLYVNPFCLFNQDVLLFSLAEEPWSTLKRSQFYSRQGYE